MLENTCIVGNSALSLSSYLKLNQSSMSTQKTILSFLFVLSALVGFSQFPGCPNIIAGADQVLPCSQNCTNISAVPFHAGATTTYTVGSIPHAPPIAYNAAGGTAVSVGTDDVWSPIINLPFPFCYYGATYTTCKVGSNGAIQFAPAGGGGGHPWSFTANCPSTALTGAGHIFGAYHDIDPSINTGSQSVKWYILGTAPCRIFVVSFNNIGHFSCTSMRTTQMIVLYETTNAIDVYVQRKDLCTGWNGGRAIIGIQNPAGTVGIAAPGRNATPTWSVPAASPEGWRFTPNGAPIYTVQWLTGGVSGTVIGTGNTINVCPNGTTTTYTAKVTYTRCDGVQIVDSDDITISYAMLPAPVVTPVAETCSGYNNGSVTINNAPGSGPYTVQIAGPAAGTVVEPNTLAGVANFTNLPDGNYTYTVTSANGCIFNGVFTINPGPSCCTVTATSTPALCFGGATGTATANPANGTAPYSYQWFNAGMVPIGQITQTATNLAAGTYNVTITDNTGCTATVSIVVGQPAAGLNATATPTNITCFGLCNGSITVNAPTGGTPGYTYSINGGAFQASNTFTGLCPGNYNIIVRDNNNCQFPINAVPITQPTDLTLVQSAIGPATCGANNGSVTVTAGGGTPGYTYTIGGTSNGTGIFTGLSSGPKLVTVTDANGCTETLNITILSAAGPAPFVDVLTNVACAGALTGSVTIGVTGGTGPYLFSLDGGLNQASNTFNSVAAGAHAVTVTDANGCSGVVNFNITQPTALTFSSVAVPATCNGVCNGQITVTANNATPPYQYSSNNGLTFQASNVLTGLCAGNINVVVQDANGCLANAVVVITQPTAVSSVQAITNPQCHQTPTGQISFAPSGGTAPYTFSVNNGVSFAPTNPVTGLMAGTYNVVVQDANGCQFTSSSTLVDPPPFTFNFIANNPSNCGAQDGSFEIIATNGLAPYLYSIDGGITTQLNNGFFGTLFSGLYNLVVEDANGCKDSVFSALSDNVMTSQTDFIQDVTCFNGTAGMGIVSQNNGAPPFTYTLTPTLTSGTTVNFSGTFDNLPADTYYVTIEDNGLCIAIEQFTIGGPDSITFTPTLTHVTCNAGTNGQMSVGPVLGGNGGPYQFSIDGGALGAASVFTNLSAGPHTILVQDGNGCQGATTVTLNQPNPFNVIVNPTDLTCNGNNSGFLQIVAAGSNPGAYSYNVNGTINGSGFFGGLAANNYNITVTDALGCTFLTTQVVAQPPVLTAGYVINNTLCNGSCDGSVVVAAAGGTPPYLYSSNGGGVTQSSATLSNLCAGNFNIFVKDANNCNVSAMQVVGQPTAVTYSTVIVPSTCGLPNGSITITANNGTPGYTYSNNNGTTFVASNVFNGLAASNYNVMVQDNNGCQLGSIEAVLSEASPVITGVSVTNVTCNAACDGELSVTANGGTGALTYDIGGAGQPGGLFTALCPNNYTITVTDANGCTDTQNEIITEPAVLNHVTVNTNLTCFNNGTGSIDINAVGGTTPYMYSFDNGVTFIVQDVAQFLAAGNYNVQVQDANGCLSTSVQILTEPAALAITAQNATNATCFGFCDGTASVTIAGGTGAYNYDWPGVVPVVNAANVSNLCAGGYNVDVTDANGCSISTVFLVTEPPMLAINSISATDATCNGTCDGTITINSAFATGFSIDNGATFVPGNVFTGVCGSVVPYDVVVENANGCTQATTIVVNEPTLVVQSPIADITICYEGDGILSANAVGGTGTYYYVWNTGDTTQFYNANPLVPTTYTCIVYDANGCASNPESADVLIHPQFIASVSADVSICPGGVAAFTAGAVGGVPGYNFEWLNMNLDTLGNGPAFSYTPTQPDSLYMVGSDQCPAYDTLVVHVDFYPEPVPTFTPNPNVGCAPLAVVFTNTTANTMPGSLSWTFGNGSTSFADLDSTVYNTPGCYDVTLTLTSIDGCVGTATYADIVCVYDNPVAGFYWNPNSPSSLEPTINIVDISQNAAFFSYNFAGLGTSTAQEPEFTFPVTSNEMTYIVCQTVTSAEGCTDQLCLDVFVHEELLFYVPNIFTPDGDLHNQVFKPVMTSGFDIYDYHLTIFNRWGEVVFESFNSDFGWNGTYGDQGLVNDGVYIWQIEFGEKMTDKRQKHRGHVTVLK